MMAVIRPVVALVSCLLAANSIAIQSNAFWLTDGSLFQQPVEQITSLSQFIDTPPIQAQSHTQAATSIAASSAEAQATSRSQEGPPSSPSQSTAEISTHTTELIRLPKTGAQDTGNGFVNNNNNNRAVCQCESSWLQNQTSVWLNKWLTSPQFANHMRSLGLVHSMARGNSSNGGQNINGANNPRASSLAWNKPAWSRRHERNSQQQQQPNRAAATSGHLSSAAASHARHTHNGQRPVQQQALAAAAAQVKLLQGERGPKGDQGERGPSGLTSVKDRDALFDLPPNTAAGPRLAFVESEQLLVLETPGPSWRPIPLLAPLHDFRRTIAKFNLNSAEERRRLLAAASSDGRPVVIGQDGRQSQPVGPIAGSTVAGKNKLAQPAPDSSVAAATEQLFERAVVKSNTILGSLDTTLPADLRPGAKGLNNETDEDEDDEDEDDDNEEDDLNMEDNDDDEDDEGDDAGADDDDAEEDNQIGANERAGKGARRGLIDSLMMSNKISPEAGRGGKRARNSQVASRSAMSAGGGSVASEQDSETAVDQMGAEEEARPMTGELMRLRLVALNEPFSGNQHGLRGANFECKRNAARAGVKGAFRALLATNYQNLKEIVRYNSHVQKYPIVNLRGDTLASSWHDLFKAPARAINPFSRIQSFDGRHVASDANWPNKLVWLGTGSKLGHRDSSSHNCDGWHSDSLNKLGFATPLHSPKAHLHGQRHPANRKRSQHRRYAGDDPANGLIATRNSTSSLVFDVIEKYPCRMPLIVLCIETVAQAE